MVTLAKTHRTLDITCESASEFLEILSPLSGVFADQGGSDVYLFRGVGSAKFTLIPAAFRAGAEFILDGNYVSGPLQFVLSQCEAELHTVRHFFETAARHGVRLPEDSMTLRTKLDDWVDLLASRHDYSRTHEDVIWPPPDFYSLLALAQHYGVATRALDWSASPLIATYFAATAPNQLSDDCIAVWSYSRRSLRALRFSEVPEISQPMIVFTAPAADNSNLRAQRGYFSLYGQKLDRYNMPFGARDHADILGFALRENDYRLTKIMVSTSESRLIRAALAGAGITAGALFPGLWGVARELREERELREVRLQKTRSRTADDIIGRVRDFLHSNGA